MLRDDERQSLAESLMEDEGPEPSDPELLQAIRDLTRAVKAIKAPDLSVVVKAIASLPDNGAKLDALCEEMCDLSKAVEAMKPLDLTPLVIAVNSLRETQTALMKLMMSPRELVFDAEGAPTGVRIARVN